jgi:hypothetical protein
MHQLQTPLSGAEARLQEVLALHFHREHGSLYWLRRQAQLGWDVCDRMRTLDDLWLLGPTPVQDLRRFPVRDFIPRRWHNDLSSFILGETAGTSGAPCTTAYRRDEFEAAFVTPFVEVALATGFPQGEPWLWIGPSGPHIIGKAVREVARAMGSLDPFSVDFDPRWAKRLAAGSFAQQRYLDHVLVQAIDVLQREPVGVLFTTPPVLRALSQRLRDSQREGIHGVHYGGLALTAAEVNDFRTAFPNAVHLSGYGNTLLGVVMETADGPREALDYFPRGDRVQFHIVEGRGAEQGDTWPPRTCPSGRTGQLVFHRLDESCLLVGVAERDHAERSAPSASALALGWHQDGLRNPCTPAPQAAQLQVGLY